MPILAFHNLGSRRLNATGPGIQDFHKKEEGGGRDACHKFSSSPSFDLQ